jgi:flagellar basal-body rod modification protein FlgD
MALPSVTTVMGRDAQSTGKVTTKANGEMGKSEFLKMLIAQMKFQDPLNPMDNSEMMAQMAQISSLEQMMNLYESFSGLQATSMLGKIVLANAADGSLIQGKVVSVNLKGEYPSLTLENGSLVAMTDVTDVTY